MCCFDPFRHYRYETNNSRVVLTRFQDKRKTVQIETAIKILLGRISSSRIEKTLCSRNGPKMIAQHFEAVRVVLDTIFNIHGTHGIFRATNLPPGPHGHESHLGSLAVEDIANHGLGIDKSAKKQCIPLTCRVQALRTGASNKSYGLSGNIFLLQQGGRIPNIQT